MTNQFSELTIGYFQVRGLLSCVEWEEGKIVPLVQGPYRYEIVVICSLLGRQKAMFADGEEHSYFAVVRFIDEKGDYGLGRGVIIVPVLPDGRLLMVIVQRPALTFVADRPTNLELESGSVSLNDFGPYSSLEFPGGSIRSGENFAAGFLRELVEETGVEKRGLLYIRKRPHFKFISETDSQDNLAVIYLRGMKYVEKSENDGGLTVLALSRNEVMMNIFNGVISSAHAGLLPWYFLEEIVIAQQDERFFKILFSTGYIDFKEVDLE